MAEDGGRSGDPRGMKRGCVCFPSSSVTVRPFVSICPPSRFSPTRCLFDFLSLSPPPPLALPPNGRRVQEARAIIRD